MYPNYSLNMTRKRGAKSLRFCIGFDSWHPTLGERFWDLKVEWGAVPFNVLKVQFEPNHFQPNRKNLAGVN